MIQVKQGRMLGLPIWRNLAKIVIRLFCVCEIAPLLPPTADRTAVVIDTPEALRPRVARALGLPLAWDDHVDAMGWPAVAQTGFIGAALCRLYRAARPKAIGDRCGFEPSCSRFAELCFRRHGTLRGLPLVVRRLRTCKGDAGGLDAPPGCILPKSDVRVD